MYQSNWTPGRDVTRHSGSIIPADMDFFATPPIEIGTVISAESTLTTSKQPMSVQNRYTLCLLVGLAPGFVVWLFAKDTKVLFNGWMIAVYAIAAFITYLLTEFSHTCTYVGELGIVEYQLKGSRSARPRAKLLCFNEAKDLYTSQTRHYYNGVYTGTNYSYRWTRASGQIYQLNSSYRSERGWPEDKSPWHFANMAESLWSGYLLKKAGDQLERLGYVEFPMKGNPQAVRVGYDFMEFVERNGTPQRVAVSDMKDISLASGQFRFNHKDARWWSGKGKYSFTYSNIPNARLFLLCLERLAGIKWG
jgi:hypothetical protein